MYENSLTDTKAERIRLVLARLKKTRFGGGTVKKEEDLMQEQLSLSPKMLVEICGGFLTWMGSALIVTPLAWWATSNFQFANVDWHAAVAVGISAPITYLITALIERRRIA